MSSGSALAHAAVAHRRQLIDYQSAEEGEGRRGAPLAFRSQPQRGRTPEGTIGRHSLILRVEFGGYTRNMRAHHLPTEATVGD